MSAGKTTHAYTEPWFEHLVAEAAAIAPLSNDLRAHCARVRAYIAKTPALIAGLADDWKIVGGCNYPRLANGDGKLAYNTIVTRPNAPFNTQMYNAPEFGSFLHSPCITACQHKNRKESAARAGAGVGGPPTRHWAWRIKGIARDLSAAIPDARRSPTIHYILTALCARNCGMHYAWLALGSNYTVVMTPVTRAGAYAHPLQITIAPIAP